jgi:phospholipid/cholesterol/gamma-HCH transport system substrate-binding protein
MDKSRLEIKVGLFVLAGLLLLVVLTIMFSKGASLFHGTYQLRLHVGNVGGLKQRAGVLLAGVQVGTVSSIQFADDGKSVTVILNVYNRNKIYHDARFVIEQSGFLGDQYVSVIPTSNAPPVLVDGADVNCQEPFNLQEVARSTSGFVKRIDETAKKLDDSVTDLRRVVLNERTLTNFTLAVNNMRTFTEEALGTVGDINALVATNGEQVSFAVSNLACFSLELRRLADAAETLLATNATNISAAVKNIETSTEVLKSLMNDVQTGKGFAGTMMQNKDMGTNMQAIANNLAVASSNLNRLGLWRFLWHKEAAPASKKAGQ